MRAIGRFRLAVRTPVTSNNPGMQAHPTLQMRKVKLRDAQGTSKDTVY